MKRVILATVLVACGDHPTGFAALSSIPLHGHVVYADGSNAGNDLIEFSILADGENLFPAGVNGGSPGDDHAQALEVVSTPTNRNGAFNLNVPLTGFVRATDASCRMAATAAARFTSVDIRAQTDADFGSCIPFCRKFHTHTSYS